MRVARSLARLVASVDDRHCLWGVCLVLLTIATASRWSLVIKWMEFSVTHSTRDKSLQETSHQPGCYRECGTFPAKRYFLKHLRAYHAFWTFRWQTSSLTTHFSDKTSVDKCIYLASCQRNVHLLSAQETCYPYSIYIIFIIEIVH